ncbi:MAG: AAC(3) family N-acetyltransferase [Armatimonadota bacterium]
MLSRAEIVAGLRALGVQPGDRVLVHSSVSALGQVEGGPDTVIDALLEAVGPTGTIIVPTFACPPPFDRRTSPTPLGGVPECLWRRPDALRSLHPTHSVAAIGPAAEELLRDHEKAPTAYAEDTPYYRLAMDGGKILLLGVDQDRNTTLHAAEAIAGAPYLSTIQGTYIDDNGQPVTITIPAMAGPHRNFIGLDRLFRERGIMTVGRIGKAVCRLMDGKGMLETALEALRRDPAAVLCDNSACADCVMQRGKIKAARLAGEDFTLAAVAGDISSELSVVQEALLGEGISAVELTPDEYRRYGTGLADAGFTVAAIRGKAGDGHAAELARRLVVPLIIPVGTQGEFNEALTLKDQGFNIIVENSGQLAPFYEIYYAEHTGAPGLAFNPAQFAATGEKPFLGVFYRGTLRKRLAHFYIDDGAFDGHDAWPGQGNGEVKEIISMLRCRGYDGVMTLRSPAPGVPAFRQAAAAFWKLLDEM